LDYYHFPKAGYFYVRRAYASILASFKEEADGVSLWITNDTLEAFSDTLTVLHGDFSGRTLYQEILEVRVPANESLEVKQLPFDALGSEDPRREYLAVCSQSRRFRDNRHFFVEIKDLVRPRPDLKAEIAQGSDGRYEVRIATDVYAYFVKLVVPIEGTRFSDNYFDLFPEQERVIEVWNEAGRRLEEKDITVTCLAGEAPDRRRRNER
jgi:beta-mannosidase